MGRASDPVRQFKRTLQNGDFPMALRMAKDLPISDADKLRLTILAAESNSPLFDRMAVRWIKLFDDRRPLTIHELRWLSERFQDVQEDHASDAGRALERFATKG